MQDQQHYLLNVLELLEGTRIDWKSLDSRNIEIFSSHLSLLPELTSNPSSNHCEASSNFFFLHSSMMSLQWIADHVLAIGWWLLTLHNTYDRCVAISNHFLSRTKIETDVTVTVGFCLGLALAMGFLEAMSSSFVVSIDSVTYLSSPLTILTQGTVVLKQRWYLSFDTVSIIMIANFYVPDWADPCILENPSSFTSPIFIARHCIFSAKMLHLLSFFCFKSFEVLSLFDKLHTRIRTHFG